MLVEFEFRVYASNGKPNHSFHRTFEGGELAAENFRKTEEAARGFPVTKHFIGAVKSQKSPVDEVLEELGGETELVQSEEPDEVVKEENNTEAVEPEVTNTSESTEKSDSSGVYTDEEDADAYPRGWHRKKEFVSKYGTVYHKGDEQPDLFRTEVPTDY
jgi:hypothetical protein